MAAVETTSVIDKLAFLVRFWELRARHATLGEPLAPHEQLELLSLMQLVTGDFRMPEPGPAPRTPQALPAQLIGEGAIMPIEVRSVSAAAIVCAGLKPMSTGERVIMRAADAVSGIEFSVPCSVVWTHHGSPCVMALAVDGIPVRSEFATPPDTAFKTALALGRQERLEG
jgi:hypothetical protein